jgi:hypothetical protein
MRGRIFVVDGKIPTPDQDSGSASTFAYLKILADAGFEVTFAPYNLWKAGRYGAALNRLGIDTPTRPRWWSIGNVVEKMAPRADVVLLYRAIVADRLFNRVRKAAPAAKILFHPVDLSFLRMQRQADISGDQALADHARKTRVTELEWVARADTTIVVSAQELALLRSLRLDAVVHHIPILREAPSNGRSEDRHQPDFLPRRDFLISGKFRPCAECRCRALVRSRGLAFDQGQRVSRSLHHRRRPGATRDRATGVRSDRGPRLCGRPRAAVRRVPVEHRSASTARESRGRSSPASASASPWSQARWPPKAWGCGIKRMS